MKGEPKKMRVEKIEYYVADDGRKFSYKEDCVAYEACKCKDFKMLDRGLHEVKVIENAAYVNISTDGEAEGFMLANRIDGLDTYGLQGKGIYLYSVDMDCYVKISDSLTDLASVVKEFTKMEVKTNED